MKHFSTFQRPRRDSALRREIPTRGAGQVLLLLMLLTGLLASGCRRRAASGVGSAPSIVVEKSEPVRSSGGVTSYAPIIERVAPSVVSVYSTKSLHRHLLNPLFSSPILRHFLGPDDDSDGMERQEESLGSGVIISKDGYIITNNHVVDGADEIRVSMVSGQEYPAKLVGVDPAVDIAVLKIKAQDLPSAVLADSALIRVGDLAFAIGNPFGVGQTVTMGIVSATERTGFGITEYEDFIQTDAAVNPGNSGGPLTDADGRVIGINTAILSRSGGYQGIGFAVPINLARFTMEQIIKNGRVVRGYLGIYLQRLTPDLAKAAGLTNSNGAIIAGVAPRSPAAQAGIKPGDVIVGVNGTAIDAIPELRLAIAKLAPGTVTRLDVLRGGKTIQVPVTVGESPKIPKLQLQENG